MTTLILRNLIFSALVNGRGEKHLVKDEHNLTQSNTEAKHTPIEVFNVDPGKTYRFRMISAAPRCFFKVSIDDHELVVIATDGAPLKPVKVQSFIIHTGKIYAVFVKTKTSLPKLLGQMVD